MDARAERRRAERAARKETDRTVRWLRGIPAPTMAAARRLAAELLEPEATTEPATSPAARLSVELLLFARDFEVPVERAAELVGRLRERGLATIAAGGAIEISEEQSARIGALAAEPDGGEADPVDEGGIEPVAPVQLTRKGIKAFAEMVWTIAEESGHSVEQVALGLRELHASGGATIEEDGRVTVLPEPPGAAESGGPGADRLAETVRASIKAGLASAGRS